MCAIIALYLEWSWTTCASFNRHYDTLLY